MRILISYWISCDRLRRLSSPAASTPASTAAETTSSAAASQPAAASKTTEASTSTAAETASAAVEPAKAAAESTSATRSQTGEAAIAVDARVRSVEASGSAAERIPIPGAAPRKIPVADAIGSSGASRIRSACPAAHAHSSSSIGEARGAIAEAARARSAGQVPALSRDLLARGGLALCERIAASIAAKPVRGGPVAIRYAAAMRGIVSPIAQAIRRKL